MRISVTQVSLALAGLGLALAGGLYWSLNRVDEPLNLTQEYYGLQAQVSILTRQSVNAYLETGDAMRLMEAQHKVQGAIDNLNRLPPEVATAVKPQLSELLTNLNGDFIAAGKLAGDPQGLLMNAEREISDNLALIADYARDGYKTDSRAAFEYVRAVQQLDVELRQLSHARQRYFTSRNPGFKKALDERIARMQAKVAELARLPLLGVMTAGDPDSLSAEAQAPEDKRIGILADLNSLLRRYPDELERTASQINRGIASRDKVKELMNALEAQLGQSEAEVRENQRAVTHSITIGGVAFVLSLLAAAALLPTFRRPA